MARRSAIGHVIILADALPWASIRGCTLLQQLKVDAGWWKIPVALDVNQVVFVGFGHNLAVPECLHGCFPFSVMYLDFESQSFDEPVTR